MVDKITIAQALYDFSTDEPNELNLISGQYFQVLQSVDSEWSEGFFDGKTGIFPSSFVNTFPEVFVPPGGKVFLGVEEFPELQHGDLAFHPGDIVVGLEKVNDDWWRGHLVESVGIFPLTHVQEIPIFSQSSLQSRQNGSKEAQTTNKSVHQFNAQDIANSEQYSSSNSINLTPRNLQATAIFDFVGESVDELTIKAGDVISFISTVDSDWLQGTLDGRTGIFPAAFVEVVDPSSCDSKTDPVLSSAVVLYDFQAVTNEEIDLRAGQSVEIVVQIDDSWVKVRTPSGGEGLCPVTFLNVENPGLLFAQSGYTETPSQDSYISGSKRQSLVPEMFLDDLVSNEMKKVKSNAERRRSLQPKPAKPPSPVRKLSPRNDGRPSRPPASKRLGPKQTSNGDLSVCLSDPYRVVNEPYKSNMTWKDQHPNPVIEVAPKKKSPPPKPALPSRYTGATEPSQQPIPTSPAALPASVPTNRPASVPANRPASKPVTPPKPSITKPSMAAKVQEQQISSMTNKSQDMNIEETKHQVNGVKDSTRESIDINSQSKSTICTPEKQVNPVSSRGGSLVPARAAPPPPSNQRPPPSAQRSRSGEKPIPVPSRVPPARPGRVPQPSKVSPITANGTIPEDQEFDEQAAEILKEKIRQLETDIELYNYEVENLDGLTHNDVDEKLQFYMENINGMTEEVYELKEQLKRMQPPPTLESAAKAKPAEVNPEVNQEKIDKRKEKRIKVIKEIVDTEESYLRDLKLVYKIFVEEPIQQAPVGIDTDTLFCNMAEIIKVSQMLLSQLTDRTSGVDFEQQIIGTPFYDIVEPMKSVYAPYCRNHDDVCALLEQYQDNQEIQNYFAKGLDELRKHTVVFTIGAFLIKPVQRILKYPLLLSELNQTTETSHADKPTLDRALNAQKDLSLHINEYKRRKDLVYKYRQSKEETLSDKMSRLNMHSIKKKSIRLSMRMTNTLGLAEQKVDNDFEREVQMFKGLERSVRSFTKNLDVFMRELQDLLDLKETVAGEISEFYSGSDTKFVDEYLTAQQKISKLYRLFKRDVESTVVSNLTKVMSLFHAPSKIIEKRSDKLLDYDSCASKVERTKEIDRLKIARDELQVAKNDYEALNSQLKDELPKFNKLTYEIFRDCVGSFVRRYHKYQTESLTSLYPLLAIPSLLCLGNIVDEFEKEHSKAEESLFNNQLLTGEIKTRKPQEITAKSASPCTSNSGQNDYIKTKLKEVYPPEKLYIVTTSFSSSEPMDIEVHEGDLVAVIVQKDPMGGKDKWYIDNGVVKGFVNHGCLKPHNTQVPEENTNMRDEPDHHPHLSQENRSPRQSLNEPMNTSLDASPPNYSQVTSHNYTPYEEYKALYGFHARNTNEISISAGQTVYVFTKQDEHGNPDWWYVQTCDGYGYTPANYLAPL